MKNIKIILLITFLSLFAPLKGHAEDQPAPGAIIVGLFMQEGDNKEWQKIDHDVSDWSKSINASGSSFNRILKPEGIAWLRTAPFALPQSFTKHPMALYIITGASFEVYWNGIKIGQNGLPSVEISSEVIGIADTRFYIPPEYISAEKNVIAIRYSSHAYKKIHLQLGLSLNIGIYQNAKYQRLSGYVPGFLLIGAVGAAAIFFGALYRRQSTDRTSLWLALMFAMVTLQAIAETSRSLTDLSFIGHILRYAGIFLFAYGSGLFLNFFILSYLKIKKGARVFLLGAQVIALGSAGVYFSQLDKATYAVLASFVGSAFLLTMYGTWKKRHNARVLLTVLMIFGLSFLVGYTQFLDSYYYMAMAMLSATLFILQAMAFGETKRKSVEAKLRLNRLEVELLKSQIQPHFIMNTLTALSEWVLTNPKSSVEMIEALADEFRMLNEFSSKNLVSLADELDLCHTHLKLMSYRQDQLFSLKTPEVLPPIQVPPAIFHTLIENAFTHNRYTADNSVFHFDYIVKDDGSAQFIILTPKAIEKHQVKSVKKGQGIGLSYVLARLEEAWGSNYSFEDGEDSEGRWRTCITIENTGTTK